MNRKIDDNRLKKVQPNTGAGFPNLDAQLKQSKSASSSSQLLANKFQNYLDSVIDQPFNTDKAQREMNIEEYKRRNNALNMAMSQKYLTNLGATHNSVHMRQKVGGTHNHDDNFATA